MHFTHHTKVNGEIKFHYYKKKLKILIIKQLGFTTESPLGLDGRNNMGLTTY
jgi:hypothetical protein